MDEELGLSSLNPYVSKLNEFSEFAFARDKIKQNKGQWAGFFKERSGTDGGPLVLEIGCSNGAFLAKIAEGAPGTRFVGMDWKYKLVYKACEKSEKLKLKNTAYLRSRAQDLCQIFAPAELDEVWLFFPDPWPKAAQQKHRLFQAPFLEAVAQVLKPGGYLHVKTDHPGYFEWMLAVIGQSDLFKPNADDGGATPTEKSKRTRQMTHRTYLNKDLPPVAEAAVEFSVVSCSNHYWLDKIELAVAYGDQLPLWWDETTLFERLFLKDDLPVHALSLRRK